MSDQLQVVWFKRDLRVADHRPLAEAAAAGPVLPLYIVEPALWAEPDASFRHWAFVAESLDELRRDLAELGQPLVVRVGSVLDILDALRTRHGTLALWSHQETGNDWTYARDRRVLAWCRTHGVEWHERTGGGVVRRLRSRRGWARRWDTLMGAAADTATSTARPARNHCTRARTVGH